MVLYFTVVVLGLVSLCPSTRSSCAPLGVFVLCWLLGCSLWALLAPWAWTSFGPCGLPVGGSLALLLFWVSCWPLCGSWGVPAGLWWSRGFWSPALLTESSTGLVDIVTHRITLRCMALPRLHYVPPPCMALGLSGLASHMMSITSSISI